MDKSTFNELIPYKSTSKVRAYVTSIENTNTHTHSESYELICVLQGTISLYESDIFYSLSPNEVFIVNPDFAPHKISSDDSDNLLLIIQFERDYYKRFFSDFENADFTTFNANPADTVLYEFRYLRFLMAQIYFEYISDSPSNYRLEGFVCELIQLLIDYFHYYSYQINDTGYRYVHRKNIGMNDEDFLKVYKIIDYIILHCTESLRLSILAEEFYMTETYLSRYLKSTIGMNFSDLMSIYRCYYAIVDLATTNKSIDDIATDSGFSNRSHFSRHFKRWYGTSPAAYRKKLQLEFGNSSIIRYYPYDKSHAEELIRRYLD